MHVIIKEIRKDFDKTKIFSVSVIHLNDEWKHLITCSEPELRILASTITKALETQ